MSRTAIPPKIRFEVFKRDKFTCQYCGARAPEVLLQVDHIKPVAESGDNNILNLITSCTTCNGEKGAVPLTDHEAIDRQVDMLAELEDRRQQLEMMMRWRDELQNLHSDSIDMVCARITECGGFSPNEEGRADLKRWLKRYGLDEIVRAVDEAFDTYLQYGSDGPTSESWNKAFSKIPGVADVLRQEAERPYLRRLLYIQGIVRRRSRAKRYDCVDYLEHLHLCGMDLDELERRAKRMRSLEDFEGPLDAWLEQIGRPF